MTGSWGRSVCFGATPLWSKNPFLSGAWWELHCVGPGQRSQNPLLFQHGGTPDQPLCLCLTAFAYIHPEAQTGKILIFVSLKCDPDVKVSYAVSRNKNTQMSIFLLIPLVFTFTFPQHVLSLSSFFPSSLITFTFVSSLCVAMGMSQRQREMMTPCWCAYATVHIHLVC